MHYIRPLTDLSRFAALLLISGAVAYSQAVSVDPGAATSEVSNESKDDVILLNPFVVSTEKDKGYRATNSISGSRLDTAIKDIPMPIEVITEDFLKDVGARDLRQSLRYSAGIVLQSQNDQGSNQFYGAGGVNNPEGATANKSQSTTKIRGYLSDVVLRDGYRRQSATDSINIGRIEVIRGPAALLYGIGNFGGIVNYLPKTPEREKHTALSATFGSYEFMRGTFDTTGPLGDRWNAAYRVSGALQSTGNHTELYKEKHFFVSPSFSIQPLPDTKFLVDFEYGNQEEDAISFQTVRARSNIDGIAQADRLQSSGFVEFAGKDNRTFRWSGPDTFRDTEQTNLRLQLNQKLADKLYLQAGYNTSFVKFDIRDVNGAMAQNVGPVSLRDTITVIPIDSANGSSEFTRGQATNTIFQYQWIDALETNERDQIRLEATYALDLFSDANRWLRVKNNFLVGRSLEKATKVSKLSRTRDTLFNYKKPTDTSYIRFGTQGDNTADAPMDRINRIETTAWNVGDYAVYQGDFLDGRLNFVGGLRKDKNDYNVDSRTFGATNEEIRRPTQKDTTEQYGVSFELTKQLTVYALKAGGLQPNFEGRRDATGAPLGPTTAESKEIGLKIDLFDGKISGTISKFKIVRTGVPFGQWWMPTLKGNFKSGQPIVYNVNDFNPVTAEFSWKNQSLSASRAQWDAAVAAGAAYQKDGNWYVNASTTTGAAYLDNVFKLTGTTHPGWPGWLYINDANTNNGWEDRGDGGGYQAFVQQEDQSEGWDAQIMFTPNNNFQLVATYAHAKRVITSPGNFIKYPHPENRWAVWMFPDANWGLSGFPLADVYPDQSDTSSWTGIGWGAGQSRDDTPKHSVSAWANYRFTDTMLKGLSLGVGGQWDSEREYFSGVTVAGQKQTDGKGRIIRLMHDPRLNVDFMAKYDFKWRDHPAYVQLNVFNVANDKDLYGLIYAPGRSAQLTVGYSF